MWIKSINQYTIIGTYKGHPVELGDLSSLSEENFPLRSYSNKVCMPLEKGVEMLYELFLKDYQTTIMQEGHSQYIAFGMFSVNICKQNFMTGDKKIMWNQYFWQQETIKLKAAGKLVD